MARRAGIGVSSEMTNARAEADKLKKNNRRMICFNLLSIYRTHKPRHCFQPDPGALQKLG